MVAPQPSRPYQSRFFDPIEMGLEDPTEIRSRASRIEKVSGVYFLFDGDELVYVGESGDIYGRVQSHRAVAQTGGKKFDHAAFMEYPAEQRKKVEASYIRKYRPKYNFVHKPWVFASKAPRGNTDKVMAPAGR